MRRDALIGVIILVFTIWLFYQSLFIPNPPMVPISPSFYPKIILILFFILGISLILHNILTGKEENKTDTNIKLNRDNFKKWLEKYHLVILCFFITGLYLITISIFGFFISTGVYLIVLSWILSDRKLSKLPIIITISITTIIMIYLIFEVYLRILFPRGIIF